MRPLYDGPYTASGITTAEVMVDPSFSLPVWVVVGEGAGTLAVDLWVGGSIGWAQVFSEATPERGGGAVPVAFATIVETPGRLRARWSPDSGTGDVLVGIVFGG